MAPSKRDFTVIAVLSIVTGLTLQLLARVRGIDGSVWWVIPSLIFAAFGVAMIYTRRRPPLP